MGDGLGDVEEPASGLLRVGFEELEGVVGVDPVSGHEDALCLLDDGAAPEGALQVADSAKRRSVMSSADCSSWSAPFMIT